MTIMSKSHDNVKIILCIFKFCQLYQKFCIHYQNYEFVFDFYAAWRAVGPFTGASVVEADLHAGRKITDQTRRQ